MGQETAYVTVLSVDGKVLEPTARCGHVRILLKQGRARVVCGRPFTIRLLYKTKDAVQGETLAIDPGRTNIGIAAVKDDGTCTLLANAVTRNKEVPKLMAARREYRRKHRDMGRRDVRQRRARKAGTTVHTTNGTLCRILPHYQTPVVCHSIRNKEARYCNRPRPEEWLTPTARHLLETHMQLVRQVMGLRPVKRIAIEANVFDFVAMEHPKTRKSMYGHGPLYGTGGLHAAVALQQEGKCLLCGKAPIEHYHHVVPRRKRGADTIANLAGLCRCCHDRVHKDPKVAAELARQKAGINKKYHALSVLNQVMPHLVRRLAAEFPGMEIVLTHGWQTKAFREDHGIEKDHCLDAYCIAGCAMCLKEAGTPKIPMEQVRQFRRQDRQACHKEMLSRRYFLDGRLVATNRHKATGQKTVSLEEFRKTASPRDLSKLTVREHLPVYKGTSRVLPGALVQCGTMWFVLGHTDGRYNGVPKYFVSVQGRKYPYRKCRVVAQNQGLVWL